MTAFLRQLSFFFLALFFLVVGIFALSLTVAKAEDSNASCDYHLRALDDKAIEAELTIKCNDPSLLSELDFLYPAIRPYAKLQSQSQNQKKYQIDLAEFADALDDLDVAMRRQRSIVLSPDVFLPTSNEVAQHRLFIANDFGVKHLTAYDQDKEGAYIFSRWQLRNSGPFILGQFSQTEIPGQDGMKVALLQGEMKASPGQLFTWIADLAKSNSRFWGKPPVPNALVILAPSHRSGLSGGKVLGGSGAVVLIQVGQDTDPHSLYEEWVGVHELLHLGTPLSRDKGVWFNEGLATYFEPILRYRAGWKSEDEIWQEWLRDMPRGYDAIGKSGLAPSGRRGAYWGGALFMLLADIELRKASQGQSGMEDCLKAILHHMGGAPGQALIGDMLNLCDQDLGNKVMSNLGRKYIDQGTSMDFEALWRDLGVSRNDQGNIIYNNNAPLAWVRSYIVNGKIKEAGIQKTMPLN